MRDFIKNELTELCKAEKPGTNRYNKLTKAIEWLGVDDDYDAYADELANSVY